MDFVTPKREPITYRLDLGDEWWRIRLDEHAEGDVKAFLDVMFEAVPADSAATTRTLLQTRFTGQIQAGRARHGLDFHIPAPHPGAGPMPALTIMTAEIDVPAPGTLEPPQAVARIASEHPDARTGVIAGMPAVRIDHTTEPTTLPDQTRDIPGLRHIEYLLPAAGDPHRRWLSIALTAQPTPTHGQDHIDTAITTFDEAVTKLTWT